MSAELNSVQRAVPGTGGLKPAAQASEDVVFWRVVS